ncbi:MAG: triose-phosphate isomerase [Promethearchaeota archaeon]
MERKYIIGGNWKMNKNLEESKIFVSNFMKKVKKLSELVDIVLFPPYLSLPLVSNKLKGKKIYVGAQNMYFEESGAFTGELSPGMVVDVGAQYVILGHSERRKYFHETNEIISKKLMAAHKHNLRPILCVGETLEQREKDKTESILEDQLKGSLSGIDETLMVKTVVAYEPVWAIGTGKTASPDQAQEVHKFIRKLLLGMYNEKTSQSVRIQYGGSVKPSNAAELFSQPDIDGGLVGGASLAPDSFAQIIEKVPL